jgi:hypothetical protein
MRMDAAGRESGIQGIELLMAGRRRGLSGQVTRLRTNSPISLSKTAASLMLTVNPRLNAVAAGRPAGAVLRQCGGRNENEALHGDPNHRRSPGRTRPLGRSAGLGREPFV